MRKDRTRQEQKEEKWVTDLKTCLSGDLTKLSTGEARICSEIADEFEADENGLLFYCPSAKGGDVDRDQVSKLVVPENLQ